MGRPDKAYTEKVKAFAKKHGLILGADFSRGQVPISFEGLADEGYKIIIHKGGQDPFENAQIRPDDPDTHLGTYLDRGRQAKSAGLLWGMFWYFVASWDIPELVATMRAAVRVAMERGLMDTSLVVDYEGMGNEGLSNSELQERLRELAREWVRQGGELGNEPGQLGGFYGSQSWWKGSKLRRFKNLPELKGWFRWIARKASSKVVKPPDDWDSDPLMWAWQPMLYEAYSPHMKSGFGIDLWKPHTPYFKGTSDFFERAEKKGRKRGGGGGGAFFPIAILIGLGLAVKALRKKKKNKG